MVNAKISKESADSVKLSVPLLLPRESFQKQENIKNTSQEELATNLENLNKIFKLQHNLLYPNYFPEVQVPPESSIVPKMYMDIINKYAIKPNGQNYGEVSANFFEQLHERFQPAKMSNAKIITHFSQDESRANELKPITAKDFKEFLKNNADNIHNEYLKRRANGISGCVPVSEYIVELLKKSGFDATVSYITGHAMVVVNVEGTVYMVDGTFNQFQEKDPITPWGM